MKIQILFPGLLILLVSACQNDPESQTGSTTETGMSTETSLLPDSINSFSPSSNMPMPVPLTPPVTPGQPSQQNAGVQNTGKQVALNPPHGQPGHRCEIPVGAPLNSAPVTNTQTAPPPQQPPTVNMAPVPQVNMAPVNTAPENMPSGTTPAPPDPSTIVTPPGMNPPHGQPGHRCEIAVGAPLPKE